MSDEIRTTEVLARTDVDVVVGMLRQAVAKAPDARGSNNFTLRQLQEFGKVKRALLFSQEPLTWESPDNASNSIIEESAAALYTFARLRLAVGERPKDTKFLSRLPQADKERIDVALDEILDQRNLPNIELVADNKAISSDSVSESGSIDRVLRLLGFRRGLTPQSSGE